jgi:hypothetical protein
MKKKTIKKPFICEDENGKKFKTHKFEPLPCECPNCYPGEHFVCIRCWLNKDE